MRLHLTKLNSAPRAFALARRTRDAAAARAIARHCLTVPDWPPAVEFLVMAGDADEALQVAQTHDQMDVFVACLRSDAPSALRERAAQHYEARGNALKAAAQLESLGRWERASDVLLARARQVRAVWLHASSRRSAGLIPTCP